MVDTCDLIAPLPEAHGFINSVLGLIHEFNLLEVPFQQLVSDVTAAAGHLEGPVLLHRRESINHFLQLHDGRPIYQIHAVLLLLRSVFDDVLSVSSYKAFLPIEVVQRLNIIFF